MNGRLATLDACVRLALVEDLGGRAPDAAGDLTSVLTVAGDATGRAVVRSKAAGVLSGLDCAIATFTALDPVSQAVPRYRDGDPVEPGAEVLVVSGRLRALLAAERTALNFLQRLSGIATSTAAFVAAVAGTGARILDTRKTTPGLRVLEKQAVKHGGGHNHRMGLFDQVLLKENHFAAAAPATYLEVVRRCVDAGRGPVVAEARTVSEARDAAAAGAAVVLLDNFAPGPELRAAVAAVRQAAAGRPVEVEASGSVRLENVAKFAECGVDRISVGALTHSAPALDLSLIVEGVK